MSAQQPPLSPKPLTITNPQFALCLVEFLKNPSRQKFFVDNIEYDRLTISKELLRWAGIHLADLGFSLETFSFNELNQLKSLNKLNELILEYSHKEIRGAVVPENLKELVQVYVGQQVQKPEGIKTKDLSQLSIKEMVRLATEIREKIRETANPKFYPEFPEATQEINEQVFKKAVNHYTETQKPPEAQVLKKIIKEVINKDPTAGLIFAGKTEVAGKKVPRISAVAQRLEPVTKEPSFKQAADTYKTIKNTTDLQCTRTNLATTLQSWGLNPRQTLEFLNEIETHHPDMSLEELRKELKLFMRTQGLSPEQEKQITSHLRTFKRYLELSPSVSYEGNVFVASSSTKRTANWLGLSTSVLSAVGLGLTEERIDQELQRTDLSTAERNRLLALKLNLREAQEKIKQKTKQDIADKKTGQYWKPGGFYFYRPFAPSVIERPTLTFFQILSSPASAIIKRSVLRGLGSLKFGKMPGLRRLGYFQPSTWKKKAKFWLARRAIGGLLLASGKGLLGKLGATIIKDGFRTAFFKGLAFVFKKAAAYAAQRMAQSVLWRMLAWLLGAVGAQLIPGIGQIVSVILVVAGVFDFIWSAFKFVKDLLGKKPKELLRGGFETSEAAAKVAAGPLSLLSLLKGAFRPKTYVEGELVLETGLKSLSTAAVLSVIGVIFLFLIVFNPLTPAFVTLYTAYKAYKGFENLVASNIEKAKNVADFLKNAGNIALDNLNLFPTGTAEAGEPDEEEIKNSKLYNQLREAGLEHNEAWQVVVNTKKYGHLQCVILATTLFNTMHPETPIPILASPKEYYPNPPAGFRNVTSVDEIGPGTLVVVPPSKSGCDCQADIYCCGHMYVILDVQGNEIVTAHAEGSTGEVYIKNLPNPKILSDVDLNKYIIPE